MDLRDELEKIYAKRGHLTPELVVTTARREDHPLHPRFEWDDTLAGEQWRRQQAHELIRSVRISRATTDQDKPIIEVRAFHAVRLEKGYTYEPVAKISGDPLLREIVLRDMEREWRQLYDRFGTFQEFLELVELDINDAKKAA